MILKHEVAVISIDITSFCNLRCPFCFNVSGANGQDVPLKQIVEAVRHLKTEDTTIILSGGEPMLYKELDSLLECLCAMGISDISMISNATIINDNVLSLLKQYNVKLQVSFNYDKTIMWDNCIPLYERQIEFIKKISKLDLPELSFRSMIYSRNKDAAEDILHIALEHGINEVYFARIINKGIARHNTDLMLSTQEEYAIYKSILRNKEEYKNQISVFVLGFDHGDCYLFKDSNDIGAWAISLGFDGLVYGCRSLFGKQFALGNYFEEDWSVILSEERLERVRIELKKELSPCIQCELYDRCIPPCPGTADHENGQFNKFCDVRKLLQLTESFLQKKNKETCIL